MIQFLLRYPVTGLQKVCFLRRQERHFQIRDVIHHRLNRLLHRLYYQRAQEFREKKNPHHRPRGR